MDAVGVQRRLIDANIVQRPYGKQVAIRALMGGVKRMFGNCVVGRTVLRRTRSLTLDVYDPTPLFVEYSADLGGDAKLYVCARKTHRGVVV
jgi:hypothetical protein